MKKATALFLAFLVFSSFGKPRKASTFDLESVDVFFEVVEKITSGTLPQEEEWERLFATPGYDIITSHFGKSIVKKCILLAFDQQQSASRDSLLNRKTTDDSEMFISFIVENYLDMGKHWNELKEYRHSYDFGELETRATTVLRQFLRNPVDSLIHFPSLTYLCFDPNGRKLDKGIAMDFNLSYKMAAKKNARYIAHEMFHEYRGKLMNKAFVTSSPAIMALARVQNEGIADLIDKDSPEDIIDPTTPEEIAKQYFETWDNTPAILKELDVMTLSFVNGEIKEDEFASKARRMFMFDGHPNGHYMTTMISKHGLLPELVGNVANPVSFARTYNKAAAMEGSYVFSAGFMEYIEKLESGFSNL